MTPPDTPHEYVDVTYDPSDRERWYRPTEVLRDLTEMLTPCCPGHTPGYAHTRTGNCSIPGLENTLLLVTHCPGCNIAGPVFSVRDRGNFATRIDPEYGWHVDWTAVRAAWHDRASLLRRIPHGEFPTSPATLEFLLRGTTSEPELKTEPEPETVPEIGQLPEHMTDADVVALMGARRHLAAGYEVMNRYANGEMRNFYGRDMDASAVMAEVYATIAPAVRFVDEVLEGVDTATVLSRLTDYISYELGQERADLDTTRENLMEERRASLAELASTRAEMDDIVERLAEARVAEILADRDKAASLVRRSPRSRKVSV